MLDYLALFIISMAIIFLLVPFIGAQFNNSFSSYTEDLITGASIIICLMVFALIVGSISWAAIHLQQSFGA